MRPGRLGAFLTLLAVVACDSRPELALCEQVQSCNHAQLLVSESVCAEQVELVIKTEGLDCQRCVTSLRCPVIEGVLSGKDKIRSLCRSCSEHIDMPALGSSGPVFITPAVAYVPPEKRAAPQTDELRQQAEAVCAQGEECEGAMLLLNAEECVRQVSGVFIGRSAECRRCASSLSCQGVLKVVHGEQRVADLCASCSGMVEGTRPGAPGASIPYLLIRGFVAAPPPPVEGQVVAAPSQVASEAKPAATTAKDDESKPLAKPAATTAPVETLRPAAVPAPQASLTPAPALAAPVPLPATSDGRAR